MKWSALALEWRARLCAGRGRRGGRPSRSVVISSIMVGTLASAPSLHAATATGLSSFEAIEEPLVKFFPATGKFERDAFVNITDQGGGVFRFTNRFNADWWDGDRDTENKDRQRAEV